MQRKNPTTFTQTAVAKIAALPNPETPNYEVAAAATGLFAFNTLVSLANCGNFSFYLNAGAMLLSAGVTANQYLQGGPMNAAKNTYARFFGSAKEAAPARNDKIEAAQEEPVASPTLK